MKKQITALLAILLIAFSITAQTVTLSPPNSFGLPVGIGGAYGFCDVYVKVSQVKTTCNGGLNVFDNNCVSYVQDIDSSTYCKVVRLTGASNVIPFNNPVSNGFGINLFADGKTHELLFIFYVQTNVWQNTRIATFTAPASSFTPPACPNKPPVAVLWFYEGSQQMVAFPNNQRDNCPVTISIAKDGTTITTSNLQSLCGVNAAMQVNPFNVVIGGVTSGGVYVATVSNSQGSSTASWTVAGSIPSKPKGKK